MDNKTSRIRNEKTKKEIGERIKKLRKEQKETQHNLAEAIGSTQNSVSKIECNNMDLTIDNLLNIATHYNVSIDFLCTGNDASSILNTLEKYVVLEYEDLSEDDSEHYICPVLKINSAFFDYLLQSAYAKKTCHIPTVQENWIKEISNFFYKQERNNATEMHTYVPIPINLIAPNEPDTRWSHNDLLNEAENYFQKKIEKGR